MKIVQTLWTDPSHSTHLLSSIGGWLSPEYHWMSWSLSCLQARKYYAEVELFTDSRGKKLLIDELNLPYTKVHIVLDDLDNYSIRLWALAKIYTYSRQTEPFIHLDGDVYIWKKLDDSLETASLIGQNLEVNFGYYYKSMNEVRQHFSYIPECITQELNANQVIRSCNTGVIGGHRLDIFQEYCRLSFDFINRNLSNLDKIDQPTFNIAFEQLLYYCIAKYRNVPITYLIDSGENFDPTYVGFARFECVPYATQFIHALGDFKKTVETCQHLAKRLRQDYPDQYYHILKLCCEAGLRTDNRVYASIDQDDDFFKPQNLPSHKNAFFNKDYPYFVKAGVPAFAFNEQFDRTGKALQMLSPLFADCSGSLEDRIMRVADDSARRVLEDVYQYEKSILAFCKGLQAVSYWYVKDAIVYGAVETLFSLPEETLLKQCLLLYEDIMILESEWDWVNGSTESQVNELPSLHQTVLIPDTRSLTVLEHSMDSLNMVLLDGFSEIKSIQQVIDEASIYFETSEISSSYLIYKQLVLDRIRELLFLGVLNWEHKV